MPAPIGVRLDKALSVHKDALTKDLDEITGKSDHAFHQVLARLIVCSLRIVFSVKDDYLAPSRTAPR